MMFTSDSGLARFLKPIICNFMKLLALIFPMNSKKVLKFGWSLNKPLFVAVWPALTYVYNVASLPEQLPTSLYCISYIEHYGDVIAIVRNQNWFPADGRRVPN